MLNFSNMKKQKLIKYSLFSMVAILLIFFVYQYKKVRDTGNLTQEEWVKKYR